MEVHLEVIQGEDGSSIGSNTGEGDGNTVGSNPRCFRGGRRGV